MEIPKEQMDKLDSFIKHWVNPSEWYESKEECQKSFLMFVKDNNVNPEDVEFVLKKNSTGKMICEPKFKNRDNLPNIECLPECGDIDRLREFLLQFPVYKTRIINGENVVDVAISIIKKYSAE